MNCKKCNASLAKNDKFCKNCGTPVNEEINNDNKGIMNDSKYTQSNNQGLDHSINQGFNQPLNQGFNQPMNQGFNQPMNQGFNQPMNQGFNQPMNQGFNQPMNQGFNQSMNQGFNQPPYGYSANYNQVVQKSDDTVKYIIIGVVGVLLIALIIFFIVGKGDGETPDMPNGGDGVVDNTGSIVSKNGFELTIPSNLGYEIVDGKLCIFNEDETWVAVVDVGEGDFSQFKKQKSKLPAILSSETGYNFKSAQTKTVKGVEYITMEYTGAGMTGILAVAKANYQNIFAVECIMVDGEYDYSFLEDLSPVLSNFKYNGSTNSIASGSGIDLSKIGELVK